jgi:hypothetical protein
MSKPKPLAVFKAEKNFGWGVARSKVTVLETHSDDPIVCDVTLIWEGYCEQPDQVRIVWSHFWEYVATELPEYLNKYSIAPAELLTTLKSSLPVNLRAYFKDETPELPEP